MTIQNNTPDIPNQETLEAIREVEYLKAHPEERKTYDNFADLLTEINKENEKGL